MAYLTYALIVYRVSGSSISLIGSPDSKASKSIMSSELIRLPVGVPSLESTHQLESASDHISLPCTSLNSL